MNVIAKISCYFQRTVVKLKLRKEYDIPVFPEHFSKYAERISVTYLMLSLIHI